MTTLKTAVQGTGDVLMDGKFCGERRTQTKFSEFTDGSQTHDHPYTSWMIKCGLGDTTATSRIEVKCFFQI